MKKQIKLKKGLSLNKETLSKINDKQMKAIAGGLNQAPVSQAQTGTELQLAGSDCCSYAASACC